MEESVDSAVVHMLNDAYLGMRASRSEADARAPGALLLEGLHRLTRMDRGAMFVTIDALDHGTLRFLAAQAIVELEELDWRPSNE